MEAFEAIFSYIANNGFAIVMCAYMIIVNTKTVEKNTEATKELITLIRDKVVKDE